MYFVHLIYLQNQLDLLKSNPSWFIGYAFEKAKMNFGEKFPDSYRESREMSQFPFVNDKSDADETT